MGEQEYLLSYGNAGDFGRFRGTVTCQRGDQVVIHTPRGQELGVVLRPAGPDIGRLLAEQFVGSILRRATDGDAELAQRLQQRSQRLFADGRQVIEKLGLPLELLDAEILLDGRQAVLYYLRGAECDPRPLIDALADPYQVRISLHDLALPALEEAEEEHAEASCGAGGCGSGGCGSCESGNCASCVSHRGEAAQAPLPATLLAEPLRVPLL